MTQLKNAREENTHLVSLREELEAHPELARVDPQVAAKMRLYLLALARRPYKGRACEEAGVNIVRVYGWKKKHEWFKTLEDLAILRYVDVMEEEADRRGVEGWNEPVYGKLAGLHTGDGHIGDIRKFDSVLLLRRLEALDPDKYARRQKQEISGPGGGPVQIQPMVAQIRDKLEESIAKTKSIEERKT